MQRVINQVTPNQNCTALCNSKKCIYTLPYLLFTSVIRGSIGCVGGYYYYPPYTDEETEILKSLVTHPR